MPRSGIQGIAEKGMGAAQSGAQNIVKEIGDQARQAGQAAASQLNITPTLSDEELQKREAEQEKKDEEEIAKKEKELEQIHREEVDRLTQATTAPKPAQPPVVEEKKDRAELPPPVMPSSPQRGPSFKPTGKSPFVGTTALGTREGGKRQG